MAGYRVKSVRMTGGQDVGAQHLMHGYRRVEGDPDWFEMLALYGLKNADPVPHGFRIEIEVEPHPGAGRANPPPDASPPGPPNVPPPARPLETPPRPGLDVRTVTPESLIDPANPGRLSRAFELKLRDISARVDRLGRGEGIADTLGRTLTNIPSNLLEGLEDDIRALARDDATRMVELANTLSEIGVDGETALRFAMENSSRLQSNNNLQYLIWRGRLLTEGFILHGRKRLTMESYQAAVGLPTDMARMIADIVLDYYGLARLPGEILPARLYPPL